MATIQLVSSRGAHGLRASRTLPRAAELACLLALLPAAAATAQGTDGALLPGLEPGVRGGGAAIVLSIGVNDGRGGKERRAELGCRRGEAEASGFLAGDPQRACADARELAGFLTSKPDPSRRCTLVYGGPETARISGVIGGQRIDRRFSRVNGCAIADWNRV